jgi:hypothetical protein
MNCIKKLLPNNRCLYDWYSLLKGNQSLYFLCDWRAYICGCDTIGNGYTLYSILLSLLKVLSLQNTLFAIFKAIYWFQRVLALELPFTISHVNNFTLISKSKNQNKFRLLANYNLGKCTSKTSTWNIWEQVSKQQMRKVESNRRYERVAHSI